MANFGSKQPTTSRKSESLGRNNLFLLQPNADYLDVQDCISVIAELFVLDWEALSSNEEIASSIPVEDMAIEVVASVDEQPKFMAEDLKEAVEDKLNLIISEQPCYVISDTPNSEIKSAYINLKVFKEALNVEFLEIDKQLKITKTIENLSHYTRAQLPDAKFGLIIDISVERIGPYLDKIEGQLKSFINNQFMPRIEMMAKTGRNVPTAVIM